MSKPRGYIPGAVDLDYIEAVQSRLAPAFAELEAHGVRDRVPIVDRAVGRVLAVLATGRRRILEIGTAYGYSTLWMASAMASDGLLTTIDPDESRTDIARGYWRRAGIPDDRIEVINRPALELLSDSGRHGLLGRSKHPQPLSGPFELVFIDALKEEYVDYLEAVYARCDPGAFVVADNVLWGGNVAGAPAPTARDRSAASTQALRAFNERALADPRLEATILPLGDGLLLGVVRS